MEVGYAQTLPQHVSGLIEASEAEKSHLFLQTRLGL